MFAPKLWRIKVAHGPLRLALLAVGVMLWFSALCILCLVHVVAEEFPGGSVEWDNGPVPSRAAWLLEAAAKAQPWTLAECVALSLAVLCVCILGAMLWRKCTRSGRNVHCQGPPPAADIDLETGLVNDENSQMGAGHSARQAPIPSYLLASEKMPDWMQARQSRRFMTQWTWTESFDNAFLGECHEGDMLAAGFGGTIRRAVWEGQDVVTKEFHRDGEGNELFKEVFLGLLIPSSPYLGFGVNACGQPRLISAYLPSTARERLVPDAGITERLEIAKGMLKALSCLAQLDLVHCDVKPDNFMISDDGTVFVIDFGSTSRPGDDPPMTCQTYAPPDTVVSKAWDVFSLGRVFCEVFYCNRGGSLDVPPAVVQLVDSMTRLEPSSRPCLEECCASLGGLALPSP